MSQLLTGDHAKTVQLQENGSLVDLTTYQNVKLRISDSKGNLLRKYALVAETDYTDLTLTGTDTLNYSIFRQDILDLSPSSMLTVEVLLFTTNAEHEDGVFIDPWSFEIGPVNKMQSNTVTDEY